MKKFSNLLTRTKSSQNSREINVNNAPVDSPEANATRAVREFCDSPNPSNQEDEVLHLPVIVEAAESSPTAAAASAQQIRKYLTKDYGSKPDVQYHAIMLIRILSDNPGPMFTRSFDQAFVKTVKDCLRNCRASNVQQLLRETLDSFEVNKSHDQGLQGILAMWRKEKGSEASLTNRRQSRQGSVQRGAGVVSPPPLVHQHSSHRALSRNQLPPPYELASRVEEAKNTAKILLQLVQTTAPEDVLSNELLREFSERCQSASRSMQIYINCDSPAPDHDTLQTLIETNEQLSLAQSRHQRAVLAARRAMGSSSSPNLEAMQDGTGAFAGPPAPGQRESVAGMSPQRVSSNGWGGQEGAGLAWGTQRPQSGEYQPPQQRVGSNGWGVQTESNSYQSPPGPPPGMMAGFHNRVQSPREQPQGQQTFSPTAYNSYDPNQADSPTTYNGFPSTNPFSQNLQQQPPQRQQRQSQFHASNPFADPQEPSSNNRRNTIDLENAYAYTPPSPNPNQPPTETHSHSPPPGPPPSFRNKYSYPQQLQSPLEPTPTSPQNNTNTSPVSPTSPIHDHQPKSPQRPGPGPWHNSTITPSFVNRQHEAVGGMVMHGAASPPQSLSQQGHGNAGTGSLDSEKIGPGTAYELESSEAGGRESEDLYGDGGASPTPTATRRVDVGGTGGLRGVGGR
ncbi:hypothetical protein MBLNU230_g1902t1 [Neophaeotheca triangularis]